ncbi:hypothetical protein AB0D97_14120 [Streptomyces roseus]|uniref:hypothetical protein n=1 Tax=Streptomyces roseus TaxID=66430 RepID=UPI00340669E7
MSPEEYAAALERERVERCERISYEVRADGPGRWFLARRNSARQSWGLTSYANREAADAVAAVLNGMKGYEA